MTIVSSLLFGGGRRDAVAVGDARPNRRRSDRITISVVSVIGFGFGLQTIPAVLDQLDDFAPVPAAVLLSAVFLSMLAVVVAAVFGSFTRVAAGTTAAILLIGMFVWPATMSDPAAPLGSQPWIWYIVTFGAAYAAYSTPVTVATSYALVASITYTVLRTLSSGGGVPVTTALVDGSYVAIVSGMMVTIITALRQAADRVDAAQAAALVQYESAVRHHANEVERIEVDALVHDSVLASFLAAASADSSSQRALATSMAEAALENLLADDGDSGGGTVQNSLVVRQLQHAADALGASFSVEFGPGALPRPVAESIVGATWQALTNSAQHAGPVMNVSRTVVARLLADEVVVEVDDDGVGFELGSVPAERLGIRLSIVDRLRSVGGRAEVESTPGRGTGVTLVWSAEDSEADAR